MIPLRVSVAALFLFVCPFVLFAQNCPPPVDEPSDCSFPVPTAAPVVFAGDTGPMRVRKSAFELTTAEVTRLRLAFAKLRQLAKDDPTDPRGWMLQANVHCWYCGGGNDQLAGEEIHDGFWFFPWHRTYLYTLEKILGQLVGDPTFALPYWDWDTPGRAMLPPVYATPNDATNPLFDVERGATATSLMPTSLAAYGPGFATVMAAPTTDLFMGQPTGIESNPGSLEGGPHGAVHIWTGQPSLLCQDGVADMGILATAAQDPIFFAHHANIDRLWDVWLNTPATPPHTNPIEPASGPVWRPHTWTYYDQNKVWYSIAVSDTINHATSLHYTYQAPNTTSATPTYMMVMASPTATKVTSAPHTATISATPVAAVPPPAKPTVLHIDGVIVPPGAAAAVRVFINLPTASPTTDAADPHYVGIFTIVPHTSAARGHTKRRNIAMALSAANLQTIAGGSMNVTLVPVAAEGAPRSLNLTYEKIYITR
ncbi:MAG: hypothetical protein JWO97_3780 [Acidobacteria bacterium]|nr:hypothetical protein [Acidobacteriota bacterium]